MKIKSISFSKFLMNCIEYLFILSVILSTRSAYAQARDVDYYIPELCIIVCCVLFLMKVYQHHGILSLNYRSIRIFVLYYLLILLYAITNVSKEMLLAYVGRFIIGIPVMVILMFIYEQEGNSFALLYKIVNVMFILSLISIFLWMFGSVLNIISPTDIFYTEWGSNPVQKSYYGVYFEQQKGSLFFYRGYRNDGIFVEAPMHALCLIVAISIELFICRCTVDKKRGKFKLIVLTIAMITTFSATGIILLLVVITLYLTVSFPTHKRYLVPYVIFFCAFALAMFIAMYVIFITRSTNTVSWISRLDGYRAGYMAWLKAPIIGNGFSEGKKYSELLKLRSGFLNSVAVILAQGGVVLSVVYWGPIFSVIGKSLMDKNRNITYMAIITFGEFVFFTWEYTFLLLLLLAFFIAYQSDKNFAAGLIEKNGD